MKILVTGAAGFIGSHLCEGLCKEGHQVYGIDNFSPYYDPKLKRINAADIAKVGVQLLEADLLDDLAVILPKDIEVVYHLAAQPGISSTTEFTDYERNNVVATQRLLNWSKSLSNPVFFINISTSSVYGIYATSTEKEVPKPASNYGVTKLTAEQLIMAAHRAQEIEACSVRLFSVYGPRERPEKLYTKLIRCMYQEKAFPLFEGSEDHERSFTYVGDIIIGLQAILTKRIKCKGEIINLGNPKTNTTREGIQIIEKLLNKKAQLEIIPKRKGDQLKTAANVDKAKMLLQYNPQTSLEEGLKKQVAWFNDKFMTSSETER